ncbi:MAG: hypothetical protein LWW87_02450 [Geobacteraceae bacterium]|nr:hypothetical protein [Geobacteraceae bacterium]
MQIVAITDIPRMTAFFERLVQQYPDLVVVNEIHRGIEELENRKPDVVLIQNHLSGLSADILHKHLKSRLGQHKARFGLISSSATLDVATSAQFETILDPVLDDSQLELALERILHRQASPAPQDSTTLHQATGASVVTEQTTEPALQQQLIPSITAAPAADDEPPEAPLTYEMPRRPGLSIISDFSRQLDTRSDAVKAEPALFAEREQELRIRDLHQEPHLITDFDEPQPWYRKTTFILVSVTLVVVVAVSLFQHRSNRTTTAPKAGAEQKTATSTPPPVAPAVAPQPEQKPALASHGTGRPRSLPSFIPKEGLEPGYGKDNPGWENYRGQTSEYRIFREKDGTIKAIQVIDRSGAGIQESFYISILKELAGATAMRPTSSEIKEGYEIRRGDLAGLQLVQYRDAQGGRMRGFVITWP